MRGVGTMAYLGTSLRWMLGLGVVIQPLSDKSPPPGGHNELMQ